MSEIIEFKNWTTERLRLLLREYLAELESLKRRTPHDRDEIRLYTRWVTALTAELETRTPK